MHPDYELSYGTCDALLLQFKETHGFYIPDAENITRLIKVIQYNLKKGITGNPSRFNSLSFSEHYDPYPFDSGAFSFYPERVVKGLEICFANGSSSFSFLSHFMGKYELSGTLGERWEPGRGSWYCFIGGERERAEKRVENYFSLDEIKAFENIGELMAPYVSRVNAPAVCKS